MNGLDTGRVVRDAIAREMLAARRARETDRVRVQRQLLAGIDNAGAVAAPQRYDADQPALGATEVARAELDTARIRALLSAERRERDEAITIFRELGRDDEVARLVAERAVVDDYLARLDELAAGTR